MHFGDDAGERRGDFDFALPRALGEDGGNGNGPLLVGPSDLEELEAQPFPGRGSRFDHVGIGLFVSMVMGVGRGGRRGRQKRGQQGRQVGSHHGTGERGRDAHDQDQSRQPASHRPCVG